MELRTDRVGLLLDQLDASVEYAKDRLLGLTDEEFLWEPVAGAWSMRARSEVRTADHYGRGDWVLEVERPEPEEGALTTIAWRLGHVLSGLAGRHEWTFGGRAADPDELVEFSPSADATLADLWGRIDAWTAAIAATPEVDLVSVGFGQYPHGLDPDLPFISIIWWTNREVIHHLAEVALLRDLWRHRSSIR